MITISATIMKANFAGNKREAISKVVQEARVDAGRGSQALWQHGHFEAASRRPQRW